MSDQEQQEQIKQALKEAYKEVLEEKYAQVGRWTIGGIVLAALGLLLYFVAIKSGWTPPAP